jgi:hypothetical protein
VIVRARGESARVQACCSCCAGIGCQARHPDYRRLFGRCAPAPPNRPRGRAHRLSRVAGVEVAAASLVRAWRPYRRSIAPGSPSQIPPTSTRHRRRRTRRQVRRRCCGSI